MQEAVSYLMQGLKDMGFDIDLLYVSGYVPGFRVRSTSRRLGPQDEKQMWLSISRIGVMDILFFQWLLELEGKVGMHLEELVDIEVEVVCLNPKEIAMIAISCDVKCVKVDDSAFTPASRRFKTAASAVWMRARDTGQRISLRRHRAVRTWLGGSISIRDGPDGLDMATTTLVQNMGYMIYITVAGGSSVTT
ncbi:uncharacterized protein F4807DRAFT_458346 [Annulohypoxylon truncatum]|uniref:uncharacterized protein n=1 Tax=Annulohypoxylon truncatum TaxID=327061 RepID=UPI002008D4E1|nr:uncharacterized protein F4807DRAFT_458346 [Annulohypoxylon truncatum]KAI1212143.1 hypothetical protein F4807DRAFT_458346 [Annulohypoxylon truncatum]